MTMFFYMYVFQVKLWDLSNNQPSCVASRNPKAVCNPDLFTYILHILFSILIYGGCWIHAHLIFEPQHRHMRSCVCLGLYVSIIHLCGWIGQLSIRFHLKFDMKPTELTTNSFFFPNKGRTGSWLSMLVPLSLVFYRVASAIF